MSINNPALTGILDQLLEGCQVIGRDWRYLYVNDALVSHGRKRKENLLGRTMMEAYPGIENTNVFAAIRECMEGGKVQKMENQFIYEDGSKAWFELSMVPIPEGVFVMSLDITEHKKAREEIMKLNVDLERRVVERTREVKAVNKELEAFAYSVSHDLRAPLRAVDGFSKILESEYGRALDEEGKRILSIIVENVRKMDALIMDLLTLSKVTRGAMKPALVPMNELVASVIKDITDSDSDKVEFSLESLPNAKGDPVLLRQAWANLISNAVKYSGPKENPRIEIAGSRKKGEIVYSVRDNGVGFDPAYAHKLFGVFQRLHRDDEFPGTGVGLAIVERIVHRHQGRVWAEGEVNKGAVVYFALPDSASS